MKGIIGYTGFVGSNLDNQIKFDEKYNSKNIDEIRGKEFDIVYCAGVSAVKWFANQNPEKDIAGINSLIENLKTIKTRIFVLISTIDIYPEFENINEDTLPNISKQDAYGKNRYYLENWVKNNFENYLIVRLPALFGKGLKKNFIYDLLNPIPSIIVKSKWQELEENLKNEEFEYLKEAYEKDNNENYQLKKEIEKTKKYTLEEVLRNYGFTSLIFTDTRSSFPFYYLNNLSKDIEKAIEEKIKVLNISVEPLTCQEVAKEVFELEIENILKNKSPVHYDMKSKYYKLYDGKNGYLYNREATIKYLREFVTQEKENETSNI